MKTILLFFASLIIFSCSKISPEGNIQFQKKEISGFKNIDLKGKFRIFYVNSSKNFIEVETYPNIFKNLDIECENQTLKIYENQPTQDVDFYNITIYSKHYPQNILISDSVEFNVSGEIKATNFNLNLKNNAKFIGSLNSKITHIDMADTSLANFKGFTKKVYLKISDTANLIAPYWFIDNMEINSQNANYAEVNVKDTLKGNIKNTAKFLYYDDPIRAFKIDKTATVKNKKLQ